MADTDTQNLTETLDAILDKFNSERAAKLAEERKRDIKGVRLGKEFITESVLSQVNKLKGKRRSLSEIKAEGEALILRADIAAYENYTRLAQLITETLNFTILSRNKLEAKYFQLSYILSAGELADEGSSRTLKQLSDNALVLVKGGVVQIYREIWGAARDAMIGKTILNLLGTYFWRGSEICRLATFAIEVKFIVTKYNILAKTFPKFSALGKSWVLNPLERSQYEPAPEKLKALAEKLAALKITEPFSLNLGTMYRSLVDFNSEPPRAGEPE